MRAQLREHVTYDGSTPITATSNDPWSKETARQTPPGAADHVARYVRTTKSTTYTYLTVPKTWRTRSVATAYDDYGMPVSVSDSGELGLGGDETCTRTWYARNDAPASPLCPHAPEPSARSARSPTAA